MKTMRNKRAFVRNAFLGVRMSDEQKARLREIARKKQRDVSNLALEYITSGIVKTERELTREQQQTS
jgi:predicted transcriptional regulator